MFKVRRRTRFFLVAVTVALIILAVWRLYDPGWRYPIKGIDVSHHQGEIDWTAVAEDDVSFAYIKATEGADWVDERFAGNWSAIGETHILRGAYHFYTLCSSGSAQASLMISTAPADPGMLPPAVDLEFAGNCSARPSVEEFRAGLDVFLEEIETHYQMTPVIYTNAHFYGVYLADDPPDVVWWIQSALLPPWGSPEWTIWQHRTGDVAGIDGDVDRNVFRGGEDELLALTERR
jgi:lysozyme